jgi:excisionase family DNA binding protein
MDELWDIARVATYLGVTERTVYNKVRGGELRAVKVGRLWRVRESDLEAWLVENGRIAGRAPVMAIAEPSAIPTRTQVESLLAPLADQLERRLVFVGLLSSGVEALGWPAPVVVGGHAVEFYTAGSYATVDIDLAGDSEPVGQVLGAWGFEREGRHWYDEALRLVVEVPGSRPDLDVLAHVVHVRAGHALVSIIGIEDLIVDRLNACKYWGDLDSCDWARTLVLAADDLDLVYLRLRCDQEDVAELLESLLAQAEGGSK